MTAQMHERLIIDGVETSMAFCPPLPEGHARLVAVDFSASRDPQSSSILYSTACWRQYQGTWEIKDARFYLRAVRGRFRLEGGEPLLADWFSGVLRIPRGRMLRYIHMGFGSVFEEELHVKIERGVVVSSRVLNNRGREHDDPELGLKNLPGGENRFPGDDQL
jgi:hypothetical protein